MLCIMPNYQTTKTGNFGLSNLTCPFLMGSKTDCFSLSWYADLLQGSCLLALQLQLTCCSLFFVDPGDIGHNDDELDLLCSKQNKAGTKSLLLMLLCVLVKYCIQWYGNQPAC